MPLQTRIVELMSWQRLRPAATSLRRRPYPCHAASNVSAGETCLSGSSAHEDARVLGIRHPHAPRRIVRMEISLALPSALMTTHASRLRNHILTTFAVRYLRHQRPSRCAGCSDLVCATTPPDLSDPHGSGPREEPAESCWRTLPASGLSCGHLSPAHYYNARVAR